MLPDGRGEQLDLARELRGSLSRPIVQIWPVVPVTERVWRTDELICYAWPEKAMYVSSGERNLQSRTGWSVEQITTSNDGNTFMYEYVLDIADAFNFSDPKSWLVITAIGLAVGFFALRGFHRGA